MSDGSLIPISLLLLLAACKHDECKWIYQDQLRHQYFQQCIETMSHQPEHNREDDNGHLVAACDSAAARQTIEYVCKEVE